MSSAASAGAWEVVELSDEGSDVDLCLSDTLSPPTSTKTRAAVNVVTPNALKSVKNQVGTLQNSLAAASKELQHTQDSVSRLTKRVVAAERTGSNGLRATILQEVQSAEDRVAKLRAADMRQVSDMEDLLFQLNDRLANDRKQQGCELDGKVQNLADMVDNAYSQVEGVQKSLDIHDEAIEETIKTMNVHEMKLDDHQSLLGELAGTTGEHMKQLTGLEKGTARHKEKISKVKAQLKSEVERLDSQLRSLKTSLMLATQEHLRKEEELEAKTNHSALVQTEKQDAEKAWCKVQENVQFLERLCDRLQHDQNNNMQHSTQLEGKLKDLRNEASADRGSLQSLRDLTRDLDFQTAMCNDQLRDIARDVADHGRQLGDLSDDLRSKLSFKASKQELSAARDDVDTLQRAFSDLCKLVSVQVQALTPAAQQTSASKVNAGEDAETKLQSQQTQTSTSLQTQTLPDAHKTTQTVVAASKKSGEPSENFAESDSVECGKCESLRKTVVSLERSLVREIQANIVREKIDHSEKAELRSEMGELRQLLDAMARRMDLPASTPFDASPSISVNTQTDARKPRDAQTQKNVAFIDQLIDPSITPPPPPCYSAIDSTADTTSHLAMATASGKKLPLTLSPIVSVVAASERPSVVSVSSRLLQTAGSKNENDITLSEKKDAVKERTASPDDIKVGKLKRVRRTRRNCKKPKRTRPSSAKTTSTNTPLRAMTVSTSTNTEPKSVRISSTQTAFLPLPSSPEEADALPSPEVHHHTELQTPACIANEEEEGTVAAPPVKSVTGVRASQRPVKKPRSAKRRNRQRRRTPARNHSYLHTHLPNAILSDWAVNQAQVGPTTSGHEFWGAPRALTVEHLMPLISEEDESTKSASAIAARDEHKGQPTTTIYRMGRDRDFDILLPLPKGDVTQRGSNFASNLPPLDDIFNQGTNDVTDLMSLPAVNAHNDSRSPPEYYDSLQRKYWTLMEVTESDKK